MGLYGQYFPFNLMTTYNFASETGDDILHHLRHCNKLNGVGGVNKKKTISNYKRVMSWNRKIKF